MTDDWNYDIDKAPRGRTVTHTVKGAKGEYEREVFVPDTIIACAKDGKTVTLTHWLPNQSRWNMFANGEEPLCWRPWPSHPEGGRV